MEDVGIEHDEHALIFSESAFGVHHNRVQARNAATVVPVPDQEKESFAASGGRALGSR
jgi:hypothetical protein